MYTLIAFDVSDDKMRRKVVKVLLGFAKRVQKSVFEADDLSQAAYLRMRSRLERCIDPTTDRLRYLRLCSPCAARVEAWGAGPPPPGEDDGPVFVG